MLVSSFIWLAPSLRGEFVYVANGGGSNNVSAYKIGLNGSLTAIPGSPFAARNLPSSVGSIPMGSSVSNTISAYLIGSDGALTPIRGSPFRAGTEPVSIGVDPAGRFAYVANKFTHDISGYQIDENGVLTPVADSPFPAGSGPDCVAISR